MMDFRWRFCGSGALRVFGLMLGSWMLALPACGAVEVDGASVWEWRASALLIVGLFLMLLEIKVISQGILGFLGAALLIAATVIIWRAGTPFWGIPVGYIIPAIATIIMLAAFLTWLAYQAQIEKVSTGYAGYIGEVAEAREVIDPEGQVFFNGSYWKAISEVRIEPGQKVRVVRADRLKLFVEPISAGSVVERISSDSGLA